MGSFSSKMFDNNLTQTQRDRIDKLLELTPETLLSLAVEDPDIYEACKRHEILRRSFILAAAKKYHTEKCLYQNVYNRTANFTLILDEFLKIQDEIEKKKEKKTPGLKFFKWFSHSQTDRFGDVKIGDAAQHGGDSTKGGAEGKAAIREITDNETLDVVNNLKHGDLLKLEVD